MNRRDTDRVDKQLVLKSRGYMFDPLLIQPVGDLNLTLLAVDAMINANTTENVLAMS